MLTDSIRHVYVSLDLLKKVSHLYGEIAPSNMVL